MSLNLHAAALEPLLLQKGLTVEKTNRGWLVSAKQGKQLEYRPNSGIVHVHGQSKQFGRHVLRGSPQSIADTLESLLQPKIPAGVPARHPMVAEEESTLS